METSRILIVVAVLIFPPLFSWGLSELAHWILLHRASPEERLQLEKIETTLREVTAARKQEVVSEEQMKQLLSKVVDVSLTEESGRRFLIDLKDVDVQGGHRTREALIRSAERALHARFARELTHGT
ncbi:MAG TPA: hypothetical protein VFS20_32205 [Longimicrobium sp.]|nr:hypothetical protein [Longimicrobium sp.]